jgi:benzoate 4-monooxygenase
MEIYMDNCMKKLMARLDLAAASGETIDLKQWISFFVLDVLGELAFSRPFGFLDTGDADSTPPIEQHVLLATMSGQTPWLIPYVNKCLPYVPFPSLQRMIKGRTALRQMAVESVNDRLAIKSDRKDLLGRLLDELEAGTDSKGHRFAIVDVQTEAFGFIIAGSHTTAASTTYALWHLLRTPSALDRLRQEIDLVPEPENTKVYPSKAINNLEYLSAVISEGFRINPVFVMPLMRVVPDGGREIASSYVPAGTDVSICNFALHHDEAVFGDDLDNFLPERWLDSEYDRQAYLMQFGAGHRACVGRNIALTEIQKLLVSLLARYDIYLVASEKEKSQKMPPTHSFGVSDLRGGMPVKVRLRKP